MWKTRIFFLVTWVVITSTLACQRESTTITQEDDDTLSHISSSVKVEMEGPSEVGLGETVVFKLTVQNVGSDTVTLEGGCDMVDFGVWNADWMNSGPGKALKPVWSPTGILCNEGILYVVTLQPGEVREYELEWDQLDDYAMPVPPGIYGVLGFYRVDVPGGLHGDFPPRLVYKESLYLTIKE